MAGAAVANALPSIHGVLQIAEHRGARHRAEHVDGQPPDLPPQHPHDRGRGGDDGDEDQHLRRSAQLRIETEVSHRPDARQLNRAQRRAEVRNRVEADDVRRQERAGSDDRRQREGDEEADEGRGRPHGPAEAALAYDEDETRSERGG